MWEVRRWELTLAFAEHYPSMDTDTRTVSLPGVAQASYLIWAQRALVCLSPVVLIYCKCSAERDKKWRCIAHKSQWRDSLWWNLPAAKQEDSSWTLIWWNALYSHCKCICWESCRLTSSALGRLASWVWCPQNNGKNVLYSACSGFPWGLFFSRLISNSC